MLTGSPWASPGAHSAGDAEGSPWGYPGESKVRLYACFE